MEVASLIVFRTRLDFWKVKVPLKHFIKSKSSGNFCLLAVYKKRANGKYIPSFSAYRIHANKGSFLIVAASFAIAYNRRVLLIFVQQLVLRIDKL